MHALQSFLGVHTGSAQELSEKDNNLVCLKNAPTPTDNMHLNVPVEICIPNE